MRHSKNDRPGCWEDPDIEIEAKSVLERVTVKVTVFWKQQRGVVKGSVCWGEKQPLKEEDPQGKLHFRESQKASVLRSVVRGRRDCRGHNGSSGELGM